MKLSQKTIFVRVKGGLGNQLFQYALWTRIVNHYPDAKVIFDCSRLSKGMRSFDLEKLGFETPIQNVSFLQDRIAKYSRMLHLNGLNRMVGTPGFIVESDVDGFDSLCDSINQTKSCIIDGYWQRSDIHSGVIQEISESIYQFQPKNALSINMQELAKNAIAVHIRLDDYQLPENKIIFKEMQTDYFINAISHFKAQNQKQRVVIFSDSPENVFKVHPALSRLDCLFAKDFCKNHIEEFLWMKDFNQVVISNSTFSYWSSTLADESSRKKRVFPVDFFCSPSRNELYKKGELFFFNGEIEFV